MITFLWIAFLLAAANDQDMPRYVFINKAPGIEWHAGKPETFTPAGFEEIRDTVAAPDNSVLRVGVSFVFDFFRYDLNTVAQSLKRYLALSEETGVPVLVNLDGMNWWEGRPDLWNWWDPNQPGYNPENRKNVEWSGWGAEHAVKIGWRNWGSQIRVLPMMNMASPAVIEAHQVALRKLLPILTAWWRGLPENKKWLFGGVKLGHEASIGINAFYYPDGNALANKPTSEDPTHGLDFNKGWHGGVQPLGYAAIATSGIKHSGDLTRHDIARVVHDYLLMLTQEAHTTGLPQELVYTHQGGTYAPWEKTLPFDPAFTPHATPGWSFYFEDPASVPGLAELLQTKSNGRWAAVEWWWQGDNEAGWRNHFERTLNFQDCRSITIYNWNCGFKFREQPAGIAALRRLLHNRTGE